MENLSTVPLEEVLFILFSFLQRQSAASTRRPDTNSVGSNTTVVGYHLGQKRVDPLPTGVTLICAIINDLECVVINPSMRQTETDSTRGPLAPNHQVGTVLCL